MILYYSPFIQPYVIKKKNHRLFLYSGLSHESHRRDVEQVYLRCSQGSLEWLYPTGAIIVNLRSNIESSPGHMSGLHVCIKPQVYSQVEYETNVEKQALVYNQEFWMCLLGPPCSGFSCVPGACRGSEAAAGRKGPGSGNSALFQPGRGGAICGGYPTGRHQPEDHSFPVWAGAQSGASDAHVPVPATWFR